MSANPDFPEASGAAHMVTLLDVFVTQGVPKPCT